MRPIPFHFVGSVPRQLLSVALLNVEPRPILSIAIYCDLRVGCSNLLPRRPLDTPSATFLNGCGYEVAEPDVNQVHSQSELKVNTLGYDILQFGSGPIQNRTL